MAEIRIHGSDTVLRDAAAIKEFVVGYGLDYEVWNIDKLHTEHAKNLQADSEQERILAVFADEIETLKARGGYQTADVISLSPDTPNLDALLAKFDKEHEHSEDEVRFVVDGRGIFTIHTPDDTIFDVEVHPGDLLVVPEGTWHWFDLCEDKTIKCIRIFTSTDGWVAEYRDA